CAISYLSGRSAGVIVNDLPAIGELAKDEREQPALVARRHFQVPVTTHESGVGAERFDFQFGELKLAHLAARALIAAAVTIQRRLPAGCFSAARIKRQLLRVAIAGHEAFEVVMIPCGDLLV